LLILNNRVSDALLLLRLVTCRRVHNFLVQCVRQVIDILKMHFSFIIIIWGGGAKLPPRPHFQKKLRKLNIF